MQNKKHVLILPSWYPPYDGGGFFFEQAQMLKKMVMRLGLLMQNSVV